MNSYLKFKDWILTSKCLLDFQNNCKDTSDEYLFITKINERVKR